MRLSPSRRQFLRHTAAIPLASLIPPGLLAADAKSERVTVHLGDTIGVVRPELHGQFAEHLGSCVYGGLWVGKNSAIPNVDGYRKAAVDYLKELGVPVLRWPGGCFADDYHWRDGIGPKRPKRVNMHWGEYVEDNSFGVHEFIGLCKKIGAEPYLAGNVGSGTPSELRDWVEYCNFPQGSTLSDERASNGSPEPFGVRYWGVGNENWGCGGRMVPEHYADLYRQFSGYMRNWGGTKLFLIACGPNGNNVDWSRKFLTQNTGGRIPDGFAMHFYENSPLRPTQFDAAAMDTQMSTFQRVENAVIQQRAILDGFEPRPQRQMNLMLDEWGVWDRMIPDEEKNYGRLWQQITMRGAVAAGLGLNMFNRQADKLYMCNIAQIVNVLHSMLLTDGAMGSHCVRTTTYYAFMMFKQHRLKTAVRTEKESTEALDLSVSASRSGNEIVVTLVNPRSATDVQADCSFTGATPNSGSAQILHHSDMNAYNSFDEPDKITTKPHSVAVENGRMRVDLPAMSIVTVTLNA